jgi:hypothetical protein
MDMPSVMYPCPLERKVWTDSFLTFLNENAERGFFIAEIHAVLLSCLEKVADHTLLRHMQQHNVLNPFNLHKHL